jgi:hypothetical protein
MSDQLALAGFLDKWRARWPEWSVAEVFVAPAQREVAVAWFALLQELLDAAWSGSDPTPGQAKLGWWAEELQGWSQGRRRHPLGITLQSRPAPWASLAATLPALMVTREPAVDADLAFAALRPVAAGVDEVTQALFAFGGADQPADATAGLLAQHLMLLGDAAVPLRIRARAKANNDGNDSARAWANELLQRWPSACGARPQRIFMILLHERIRRFAGGGDLTRPLPRMAALWSAWRAARD